MIDRTTARCLGGAAIGWGVFGVLAGMQAVGSPLQSVDNFLAPRFYEFTNERPTFRSFVLWVTDRGAGYYLQLIGWTIAGFLVGRRMGTAALVWGVIQLTNQSLVGWWKYQFERPRPPFADAEGFSFPSGHAFGSAAVFGMAACLLLTYGPPKRITRWVAAALFIWIVLVALSRMFLGVHYLTDVTAGTAGGLGWACLGTALVTVLHKPADRMPMASVG